ncbi:MAG: beta-lactamase family protein, partial [Proteobacteria bacterium]|nr:beta-lactamase family protein [Pseudomonadota bacterium]
MRGNGTILSRDRADKIDALFAKWTEKGEPGGALALVCNGELIHQRCYGLANVEHRVPIQPDTRFHIASITKTFVGAAIVLLHRQGKLSLDGDVRDHVPELAVPAPLSLRRLLTMTSGLRDSMESMTLRGVWFRYPRSEKDLLDLLFNQRSMSWPTGQRCVYTNINFNLLSLVIERVSGRPFAEFLAENIWQPLGMAATQLRDSNTIVVPDLADAYIPHEGKLVKGAWAFGIAGAGGLVSNLPDLMRWQGMFRAGGVGGVKLLDMMAERGQLNDGRLVHYGLGLGVRGHRGVTVLCHGGSLPGYKAMFARVPERDFGLVLLSNREDAEPYTRLYQIIDIALDGELPEPSPSDLARSRLPAMTIAKETWGALDGRYLDAKSGEPLDVKFNRDTATI